MFLRVLLPRTSFANLPGMRVASVRRALLPVRGDDQTARGVMNDGTTDRKGSTDAREVRRLPVAYDRSDQARVFSRGQPERGAKAPAEACGGGVLALVPGAPDSRGDPW